MKERWLIRFGQSRLVRNMLRMPIILRLLRTNAARKLADVMRRSANRIEAVNGQLPTTALVSISSPSMPDWVAREMYEIAHMEPELVPAGGNLGKYVFYSVPSDPGPGEAYFDIASHLGSSAFSHVLLVPWLKQGGADRGAIYHAKALAELKPDENILVVSTEPTDSPWADRLPHGVTFLNFGGIAGHIDFNKQVLILARLLIQISPQSIHLINSRAGWEVVRNFGLALRQVSKLYASLFCDDFDSRMQPVGYARDYLRDSYQHFCTIYCDNSHYPQVWAKQLGVPIQNFTVLPFPYDGLVDAAPERAISSEGASRVVWAGRFDRQKRLDVLARIAQAMPDVAFDVYGTAVISSVPDHSLSQLRAMPNVFLNGEFKRFQDVASSSHFAYLLTTSWEGTPTILFDAAAAGLPICAPRVGGIPDFLGSEGLIDDPDAVDAFVQRLGQLRYSAEERDRAVLRQRGALVGQRGWPDFVRRVNASQGTPSILGS